MYQITALYYDAEVSYGEGESQDYAMQECVEAIPSTYESVRDQITFSVVRG